MTSYAQSSTVSTMNPSDSIPSISRQSSSLNGNQPQSHFVDQSSTTTRQKVSEYFPCSHAQTIRHKSKLNCFTCGIFLHESGVKSYKSMKMKFGAHFDPSRYLTSALKKRLPKITVSSESDFAKSRSSMIELIAETSEKLRVTPNTMHLGVMFMDLVLSKGLTIPVHFYPVYAATCLMLAAKSIELDERVPFISKLQRYSGLNLFKPRDFAHAEQNILRELNWNLQCTTPIDVFEYYLSQGVVFSTDSIQSEESSPSDDSSNHSNALRDKSNLTDLTPTANFSKQHNNINKHDNVEDTKDFSAVFNSLTISEKENNGTTATATTTTRRRTYLSDLSEQRVHTIVTKIEKDYIKLSNLLIRDSRFYDFELQIVCAAGIAFLRKLSGLTNLWPKELFELSNRQVSESSLEECLSMIESRFRHQFVPLIPPSASGAHQTKRGLLSPNQSNIMARDSENQNKPPTTPIISSTTPTKFMIRSSNIPNGSSYVTGSANSIKTTLGSAAKQLFTNSNSSTLHQQPLQAFSQNLQNSSYASKMKSVSSNGNFLNQQQQQQQSNIGIGSNSSNGSLVSGNSNHILNSNFYSSTSNSSSAALQTNLNSLGIQSLSSQSSSSQAGNPSFIRSNNSHHHTSYQPSSYLGLMRFGSNIL